MPRRYTAAIIGLGGFSRFHAQAYSMVKRVRLVAACDLLQEKHAPWLERCAGFVPKDTHFHTDAAEMLRAEKPDLVSITTKHDAHAPLTLLCAKAGVKGIYCEKPIAMNLGEADAMLRACDRAGTKLAIGHQRRFNEEWLTGLRLFRRGTIGKPILAVSRWPDNDPKKYSYALFGGGPLMWLSIHSIDLLRFFLGDVDWVTAQVDLREPAIDVETRAYALLHFQSGAQAIVDSGQGIGPEATIGHSIVFYGDKGTLHVCDGFGARYKTKRNPKWRQAPFSHKSGDWSSAALNACADEVRDLIRCIERGGEPRCSGREGRAALEVTMAIYESERTGGPVRVPLKKRTSPLLEMTRDGGFGQATWRT
jgi:predicted dehydrogenase